MTENMNNEAMMNGEESLEKKGVPVDGYVTVTVGTGNKDAFLSIYEPRNGGRAVTYEQAIAALDEKGVRHGIDFDAIKLAVKNPESVGQIRAAFWTPPVDGIDGTVTYHFDKTHELAPKEDEKGFVDYKNLGLIRNILKGTVIADITLPTEGEPGIDVKGVAVQQRRGKKAAFTLGQNTMLNTPGTQILAACNGHLKFSGGCFSIDSTVTIKGDVDASVGNIDFIGDIVIKGEVLEGFKVSSQKSIHVDGNVTGAVIEAGQEVVIKKGCINSNITAHGDVTIGFCESAKIVCDGNLKAQSFVTCDVYCAGTLTAQGGEGVIMGGKYIALQNIDAQVIGTKNYTPTSITVGDNAMMSEEKENLEKEIAKIVTRMTTLKQVVDFLNEKKKQGAVLPPEREEMLTAAVKERIKLNCDKGAHEKRIKEINQYLQNKQSLAVACHKQLYPGVKVVINDSVYNVSDQWVKVLLTEDGGEIKPIPM